MINIDLSGLDLMGNLLEQLLFHFCFFIRFWNKFKIILTGGATGIIFENYLNFSYWILVYLGYKAILGREINQVLDLLREQLQEMLLSS